jgi:hypothetical protein
VIGCEFGLLLGWRVLQTRGARGFGVLTRLSGPARGCTHLGRAPFTIHSVNHSRSAVRAQQSVVARAEASPVECGEARPCSGPQGLCACVRGAGGEPDGTDSYAPRGGWTLDSNMHELPFPFPAHAESWESFAR